VIDFHLLLVYNACFTFCSANLIGKARDPDKHKFLVALSSSFNEQMVTLVALRESAGCIERKRRISSLFSSVACADLDAFFHRDIIPSV
jgi:uncharacterized protein (UPF0332 family)